MNKQELLLQEIRDYAAHVYNRKRTPIDNFDLAEAIERLADIIEQHFYE